MGIITTLIMNKKILSLSLSFLALSSTSMNVDASLNKGGRVVIYSQEEPKNLDPLFNIDDSSKSVYNMIYSGLVKTDDTFNHYADLAVFVPTHDNRGVIENDEGMIVTYKIKDLAFWHDGLPVTAEDIKFTWQCYTNPNIKKVDQEYLDGYSKIYKIESPNPKTVKIYFSEKYDNYNDLFRYVLPKHGFIPKSLVSITDKHPFNYKPIGSGPFKFIEWKQGQRIVMDINHNYYKSKPYLDQIVYNYGDFNKNVIRDLEKGSIHIYQPKTPESRKLISSIKGVENFVLTGLNSEEMAFNMDKETIKDIDVRRAIIHAINKDKISEKFPELENSLSDTHPISMIYDTKMKEVMTYDLKKSQYLLDKSGWIIDENDGFRKKDGKVLEFNLLTTDSKVHNAFSEYLKENMKYLGVSLNTVKSSESDFKTKASDNNYDIALYTKNLAITGNDRVKYLSSKFMAPQGFNYSRYNNPSIDSILNNPVKTDNLYNQKLVSDLIRQELPVIPLFNYTRDIAVSAKVNNFKPNMIEGSTWNSTEWWLN